MNASPTSPAEAGPQIRPGDLVAVVNPASGGALTGDELRDALESHAAADDTGRVVWCETTEDDPGQGAATAAVRAGAATVVACGGDGTVRACLDALAGTETTLGIVPLGTGNLLAANLDVPAGLDAVELAVTGPARTLDVGVVNGEAFAVMAGTGFDAMMIRDASSTLKSRVGSAAYVFSAARNLPARVVPTTVEVDGRTVLRARAAMVLVGNCGSVTGGLEVFPDAQPDDGLLEVAVLTASRFRDWVSVLWRLLRGTPQRPDLVRRFRGTDVVVTTASPLPYELDGEDRPPTDRLEFSIRPAALHVRVGHG